MVDIKKANELLRHGHILATEIADGLTLKGLPFSEADKLVAAMVVGAETKNIQVHELENDDLKKITDLRRKFKSRLSICR